MNFRLSEGSPRAREIGLSLDLDHKGHLIRFTHSLVAFVARESKSFDFFLYEGT